MSDFDVGLTFLRSLPVIMGSPKERSDARDSLTAQYLDKFGAAFPDIDWSSNFLAACKEYLDNTLVDSRQTKYWPTADTLIRIATKATAEKHEEAPRYGPENETELHLAKLRMAIMSRMENPAGSKKKSYKAMLERSRGEEVEEGFKIPEAIMTVLKMPSKSPDNHYRYSADRMTVVSTDKADAVIAAYDKYALKYRKGGLF